MQPGYAGSGSPALSRASACPDARPSREKRSISASNKPVVVQLGPQVQEDGAEADGGPVHEDELARDGHRPPLLQRLVDLEGLAAAVFAGLDPVRDGAHPVVEERPVDEAGPDVEDVDQFRARGS